MSGEHDVFIDPEGYEAGSSPRERGAPKQTVFFHSALRIIPA